MADRGDVPAAVEYRLYGVRYQLNLNRVRLAMAEHAMRKAHKPAPAPIEELARAAKVSRMTLWRFFSGHVVAMPTLARILSALGVRWQDVMTAIDEGRP